MDIFGGRYEALKKEAQQMLEPGPGTFTHTIEPIGNGH